ncbi:MAG: hypothetical protein J7M18_01080, partial [Candidatus Eremiobacteraeota bacterium]|nr:hypothetical protein [Candidatus Eremiobacteraeota bacterium]
TTIRSTTALFPIFLGIGLIPVKGLKKAAVALIIMLICEILFLSPLLYRNYEIFHKIFITRGIFWHTIWVGLEEPGSPLTAGYSDLDAVAFAREIDPRSEHDTFLYEKILKKDVLGRLSKSPFLIPKLLFRRILQIFYLSFSIKHMVLYTILALAGGWFVLKRRLISYRLFFFFFMMSFYFLAVIIAVFRPYTDYILPGFPFFLGLSGAGITCIIETGIYFFKRRKQQCPVKNSEKL